MSHDRARAGRRTRPRSNAVSDSKSCAENAAEPMSLWSAGSRVVGWPAGIVTSDRPAPLVAGVSGPPATTARSPIAATVTNHRPCPRDLRVALRAATRPDRGPCRRPRQGVRAARPRRRAEDEPTRHIDPRRTRTGWQRHTRTDAWPEYRVGQPETSSRGSARAPRRRVSATRRLGGPASHRRGNGV